MNKTIDGHRKIGKLLASARIKRGLTQEQVAKRLGFSTAQQVSNIERSASPVPFRTIVQLCAIYKLNKKKVIETMMADYKERINTEFKKANH